MDIGQLDINNGNIIEIKLSTYFYLLNLILKVEYPKTVRG